jgi:hypothetical protein
LICEVGLPGVHVFVEGSIGSVGLLTHDKHASDSAVLFIDNIRRLAECRGQDREGDQSDCKNTDDNARHRKC